MTGTFSAADKLACIERELKMRLRVYPRWVEQRRITQQQADRETRLMEEIRYDYVQLAAKERLI